MIRILTNISNLYAYIIDAMVGVKAGAKVGAKAATKAGAMAGSIAGAFFAPQQKRFSNRA